MVARSPRRSEVASLRLGHCRSYKLLQSWPDSLLRGCLVLKQEKSAFSAHGEIEISVPIVVRNRDLDTAPGAAAIINHMRRPRHIVGSRIEYPLLLFLNFVDVLAQTCAGENGSGRPDAVVSDPRLIQIAKGIEILSSAGFDRAERIQMLFSDPYIPQWNRRYTRATNGATPHN